MTYNQTPNNTNKNPKLDTEYVVAKVDLGNGPEWSLIRMDGASKGDGKTKGPDGFVKRYGADNGVMEINVKPIPDPNLWNNPEITPTMIEQSIASQQFTFVPKGMEDALVAKTVNGKTVYNYKPEAVQSMMKTINSLREMTTQNNVPVIDGTMVINQIMNPKDKSKNVNIEDTKGVASFYSNPNKDGGYTIQLRNSPAYSGDERVAPISISFRKDGLGYSELYSFSHDGFETGGGTYNPARRGMDPTQPGFFNSSRADNDYRAMGSTRNGRPDIAAKIGTEAPLWQPTPVAELGKLNEAEVKAGWYDKEPENKMVKTVIPGMMTSYLYAIDNDKMDRSKNPTSYLDGIADRNGGYIYDYKEMATASNAFEQDLLNVKAKNGKELNPTEKQKVEDYNIVRDNKLLTYSHVQVPQSIKEGAQAIFLKEKALNEKVVENQNNIKSNQNQQTQNKQRTPADNSKTTTQTQTQSQQKPVAQKQQPQGSR